MEAAQDLEQLRVFVAEDETLIAMLIEEMLADLNCEVVGPYNSLDTALEASRSEAFDVALVDMNLAGQSADPILAELAGRSIPVAIASGTGPQTAREDGALSLDKPFTFDRFSATLQALADRHKAR